MLFSKQKNGTPDVVEEPPRTTDDPEVRQRAHDLLRPAKLEKVESQLRSYGTDDRLTEEEVVSAAAASHHAHHSAVVSSMFAAVSLAVALGVGLGALARSYDVHWAMSLATMLVGFIGGIIGAGLGARSQIWYAGAPAAVREIITIRREAGTLTIGLTEESR